MYIAVSGNIGSGKTSLVEMLSERLNVKPYFEQIDNPYLDDFYRDMNRWAFNLQICFLGKKIQQLFDIVECKEDIIQDRTIYEEAYVFVANLNDMGLISHRDYDTYINIFNLLADKVPKPDVVIYLKASVPILLSQIYKRGRDYEMSIQPEYLERLNMLYEQWINEIYDGKVITIEVDNNDFIINPEIVDDIIQRLKPYVK
ncbi:MAG: deoxynucleoside kinase [Rikenellaceae bacterium]